MLVHLLSAYSEPPAVTSTVRWLRESAAEDPFGQHRLTDDPAAADIILFVENHPRRDPYLLRVRRHPVYRNHPEKSFLYHDADYAVPILRGLYTSIRRRDYQPERCRSWAYIARLVPNDAVRYDPAAHERKWLYSFFGEANSPVRSALFNRDHPHGLVRDTSGKRIWQMKPGAERENFMSEYAAGIRDSRFVLCPAGLGPLSYRLFETMEMGRVPVILSDDWVPPEGPRWSDFSLQLPENLVPELESILAGHAGRHEEMGRFARQAWEQWFAKPVCFHRMAALCVELKSLRPGPLSTFRAWRTLMRPPHLLNWLRPYYLPWKNRAASALKRFPPVKT